MNRHSIIPLILIAVSLIACKPSVPSGVIPPDDMEDIIYDYHLAQAMSRKVEGNGSMDLMRTKYFQAVLRKHEVTEAEFDSSLVYYYSHVDYLHSIYGHVNERLSDEAKVLGAGVGEISRYSQLNTTGDTANIWKNITDVMLMPKPTMNRYDFTITTDSTFKLGDSFMFQFMSDYLWQSGTKETTVCIVSEYEDTVIQVSNRVSVSGVAQVRVPAYNKKLLKQMRGFVHLGDGGDNSNTRKILFISQIQLIRFHNQQLKDETNLKNDSVKADSIKLSDNGGREMPDTARHRNLRGRAGGKVLPLGEGNAIHGMDAGNARHKIRER